MQTESIRPSTVDGIKQLAKKIKRERNTTHCDALNLASRQAGFENFVHAKRRLTTGQPAVLLAATGGKRVFPVFLSAHWAASHRDDPELKRRAGREILRVDLDQPLSRVVAKHRVSAARNLGGFRMEYADHLEHMTNLPSLEVARKLLVDAASTLRFMQATGLQPVTTAQQRAAFRTLRHLPGEDHTSQWIDPVSGSWVLLDEPYKASIASRVRERDKWVADQGLHMLSPSWSGLHYPGECQPYLISSDLALLERTAAALTVPVKYSIPETWPHETGLNGDDFISPQRLADGKPRKPRPGPSYRDYKGATPYGGAPGIRSKWRPAKAMPLASHRQLGVFMQQLSGIPLSSRVGSKLMMQRPLLEEWVMIEHRKEHGESVLEKIYYGGPSLPSLATKAEYLESLVKAKTLVEQGYDDCKPRCQLIAALDAVTAEIESSRNTDSHT